MEKTLKLQIYHYLLKIYQALNCKHTEKCQILKQVKKNIKTYMEETPGSSCRSAIAYFGRPEEIAAYYLLDVAPKQKFLASRPVLRIIFYTICCLILITAVFFLGLFLLQLLTPTIPVYIR